jgi:hypothetical protein
VGLVDRTEGGGNCPLREDNARAGHDGDDFDLVPLVIDSAVEFPIDGSTMTEMHRDRETSCREEVCSDAQR